MCSGNHTRGITNIHPSSAQEFLPQGGLPNLSMNATTGDSCITSLSTRKYHLDIMSLDAHYCCSDNNSRDVILVACGRSTTTNDDEDKETFITTTWSISTTTTLARTSITSSVNYLSQRK